MIYKYKSYKCPDCKNNTIPYRDDCSCSECENLPLGHPDRDIAFRCGYCDTLNIDYKVTPPKDENGQPQRYLYEKYG